MDFKQLFTTYDGRITRKPFWIGNLILAVINVMVMGLATSNSAVTNLIAIIISLALIYPSICVAIKRFHDRGKSGWWVCIAFIPILGLIWYIVEAGFLRGTVGPNAYGEDPLIG